MLQSNFSQTPRLALADTVIDLKARKNLSWQDLTDGGVDLCFRQHPVDPQRSVP
jgi:cyanate lyase